MKIAVIAKTRLPVAEPFRGGLEAFTHALCTEYIRQGHTITVYAHSGSDPKLHIRGFYGEEHQEDKYYEIYEQDEYLSILNDIENNEFDVVHNNSTHELPILWGVKASIPVITTLHTPPISKLKAAIKICSSAQNLHFVMPSKTFEATWRPYLDKDAKIIYNGVDLAKWPMIRNHPEYLFWFGRIVHAKGLDIVLDAAHEINMPLKFAGPLDDKEYFDEHITPRMSKNDTYLGHLNQLDIHANMSGAAVAISAVRWEEPFGLTNIEAMSSGVPIAGFNRGAFPELIDTNSGVVADQRNVISLVKAITHAIPLESNKVRLHAEKFSLITMVKQYINYFEELI